MTPFQHILVPTDFGEPASHALDLALEIATRFESKVTLAHASWLPPAGYGAFSQGFVWPSDEMERAAQRELEALVARTRARYARVDSALLTGEPWHAILEAARERGCDLIVMGTHGRHGIQRFMLGSVAEKVLRSSPVPVLTVADRTPPKRK